MAGFLVGGGRFTATNTLIRTFDARISGYSFRTNQYGLSVDSVVAYNLVLPNGTIVTASEDECPELLWALKVWLPCHPHD